ncbi:MAG TPA: hypothetical protein VMG58_04095 [Candidatus Sulfotelmatobacter sp.]|nr:hypothetical protein [Candidatus Sulfotelmatobacter sp.]
MGNDEEREPEENERRALRTWLEELRGRDLSDSEVEEAAQRLAAAGSVGLPVLLAHLTDPVEDPALLAVTSQALRVWPRPYPVERLLALLRKREMGALAKALILRVLEGYGLDTRDPTVLGVAIDLEEHELRGGDGGNGHGDAEP